MTIDLNPMAATATDDQNTEGSVVASQQAFGQRAQSIQPHSHFPRGMSGDIYHQNSNQQIFLPQIDQGRNGQHATTAEMVSMSQHSFGRKQSGSNLSQHSNDESRQTKLPQVLIRQPVKNVYNKPMIFTERHAAEAYRDQVEMEYKYSNGKFSIPHYRFKKDAEDNETKIVKQMVPVTEDIAYLQSLIEMQDWKRRLQIASTLQQ